MLQLLRVYAGSVLATAVQNLRSFSKFIDLYSVISVNLIFKGFCHPDQEQQGKQQDQNQQGQDE